MDVSTQQLGTWDSIRHQDKTNAIVGLGGGILRALERLGYAQVAMGHTAWSRVQGYFGHVATTIGADPKRNRNEASNAQKSTPRRRRCSNSQHAAIENRTPSTSPFALGRYVNTCRTLRRGHWSGAAPTRCWPAVIL
ncbi:unnamed protein product [Diplocarpon coronariae]